jgi:hypothetical protein
MGNHRLYVNGGQLASVVDNTVTALPTSNRGVTIGYGGTASSGVATLSAEIDEVTVWGDELSVGEIALLASIGGVS